MKYIISLSLIFLFSGCLYFNDRGISGHLYDNCHSYYDANGEFVETCDENIIDYGEIKDGAVAIKDEIKDNVRELSTNIKQKVSILTNSKSSGIKVEELTPKERAKLQIIQPQTEPIITIEEKLETNQCPCR